MFIEKGRIVSTSGRNIKERSWTHTRREHFPGLPMVILVNRYSASASEIVSACLQDHKRALVVGERTWGKGSVQNIIELEQGKSALKLTTAGYHRPSGQNIHRFPDASESDVWGVMPNKGYKIRLSDKQLQDLVKYRRDLDIIDKNKEMPSFDDPHMKKAIAYLQEQINGKPTEAEKPGKNPKEKNEPPANTEEKSADKEDAEKTTPQNETNSDKEQDNQQEQKNNQPKNQQKNKDKQPEKEPATTP